jgi:hypothetical protein
MSLPRVGKQKARDEILPRAGSARWAYLALLRGTRSGNDRLGTRVQGLSFGVRRLVAAFARRDSSRRASAPVTSHRRQKAGASSRTPKATPPIRAPALDGQAKAAPYTGPDDEPGRRPKDVHLRAAGLNFVTPRAPLVSPIGNRQSSIANRRVPYPAFPTSDSGLVLLLNFESAIRNSPAPNPCLSRLR